MLTAENITENKRPFIEPGWYRDLSNEEYHGSFGIGSTTLKTLVEQTPAHMLHKMTHPQAPTQAMALGTAVHTMVLEPEKASSEIAVEPIVNKRTNAGKAVLADFYAENAGKTIITETQLDAAEAMAASVHAHPMASILLEDIIAESSVYWWYKSMDPDDDEHYKVMLKVRPDALNASHSVIIDLKTTRSASETGFTKQIQNLYYHLSAAMYLEGVNRCKPLLSETGNFAFTKFVFVCVENEPPYAAAVYELSDKYLQIGKALYRRALRVLSDGMQRDWPAYPDEIRTLEPPPWAERFPLV